jgi:biotin carboxyl carrier protein
VQFDLEIGGQVRCLQVDRRDGRYQVAVDDRVFEVDPRSIGRQALSLLVQEGDGPVRSVDATVNSRPGSTVFEVGIDGHTLVATLVSRVGARAGEGAAAGAGPQQVTAPMPGKVVRVLVAPGDAVEPRQGLVVIEAMKMENELRASRAGRVKAVGVAEGQSVEAGTLLVSVE